MLGLGCPQMQGYYFYRPCPAEDLLGVLTQCTAPRGESGDEGLMPADLGALADATGKNLNLPRDLATLV